MIIVRVAMIERAYLGGDSFGICIFGRGVCLVVLSLAA